MSSMLASWGAALVETWIPTVLLAVFAAALVNSVFGGRPKNFPPGMMILPVVGSLLSMPFGPSAEMLRGLRKKYGDVASFAIFGTRVVMVSNPKLIKETFSRQSTAGRPEIIFGSVKNMVITNGRTPDVGIVGTNGQIWQEQQRFLLHHLGGLGFGKSSNEPLIIDEIAELIDILVKEEGRPVEMSHVFHRSMVNVLWILMMGKRYPHNHARLNEVVKDFFLPADFNPLSPEQHIPHIFKVIEYIPTHRKGINSLKKMICFIKEELKDFMANEELKNGNNFVAVYLKEIEKKENSNFNMDMMEGVVFDMFLAGTEPSSSTLTTAMYLLAKHPHVQRRVQQELDEIVGKERCPTFHDLESLPYVQATIQEVQRTFNLPKYSLPHITTADCKIGGYDIPKGTWLLTNLDDAHKNSEYWKNASEFDPQNFLDENGKYKRSNASMPFGSGKRLCTGEQVARQNLFLFFTHVMQKFSITLVQEHSPLDDSGASFTDPPRYTASFVRR